MRKSLVAGNWKLNGSIESISSLVSGIVEQVDGIHCEVAVAPVFVHLDRVSQMIAGSAIKLSAQDCAGQVQGAFTGEVSPVMLKELSCEYVILGHSERRSLFSETDQRVAEKVKLVLSQEMKPILCVGETLEEREQNVFEQVVESQIVAALKGVGQLERVVIAYEPVWAIGTGLTATPEQAQSMHAFIRGVLKGLSVEAAEKVQILYGGSVKPENAVELFGQPDIDGGLIGGASLKVDDFVAICKAAG